MKLPKPTFKMMSFPARLGFPVRVGLCLGLLLIVVTIGIWVAYAFDPRFVNWGNYMTWPRALILSALLIGASVSTWLAVRIWFGGGFCPDRQIDREFTAGIQAMRTRGITPASLPIHVLLGSPSSEKSTQFVSRTNLQLRCDTQTEYPATIQWLASSQAITLSPIDCGLLNLTLKQLDINSQGICSQQAKGKSSEAIDPLLATLQRAGLEPGDSAMLPVGNLLKFISNQPGQAKSKIYSDAEATLAQDRLQQVCERLNKVREPLCPINHLVIRLPAPVLLQHPSYAAEIGRALRYDLELIRETLGLDVAVSVVVEGWQHHPGFVELIRRLGPHAVETLLPGCHCNVESESTSKQLTAIADRACADIENHIYEIFQRPDALTHAGNSRLYQLLSDVRVILRPVLTEILVGGLAQRDSDAGLQRTVPISGCFLMATGETPPFQGFAAPFGKHAESLQERIAWHSRQVRTDRVCRLASRLTLALSLLF
ncbi:MAG: hypothetical protein KDA84_20770, partial [Planctomycetaceae bacterium]|nr:hypothetical protein [Planctomycetaceae bacterium]